MFVPSQQSFSVLFDVRFLLYLCSANAPRSHSSFTLTCFFLTGARRLKHELRGFFSLVIAYCLILGFFRSFRVWSAVRVRQCRSLLDRPLRYRPWRNCRKLACRSLETTLGLLLKLHVDFGLVTTAWKHYRIDSLHDMEIRSPWTLRWQALPWGPTAMAMQPARAVVEMATPPTRTDMPMASRAPRSHC